jgi:hypothetical protein
MTTTTPQHPAGPYVSEPDYDEARRAELIAEIAALPADLRAAVADLDDATLDTRYSPTAWTVRQIVHHVPDSHANAYVRWTLALSEDHPTIRPYDESACAQLAMARTGDIEPPLVMLEGLHVRWIELMRSLTECLPLYAWHGRHHLAQVHSVRERSAL